MKTLSLRRSALHYGWAGAAASAAAAAAVSKHRDPSAAFYHLHLKTLIIDICSGKSMMKYALSSRWVVHISVKCTSQHAINGTQLNRSSGVPVMPQ